LVLRKMYGMRKVSQASKNIPGNSYIQISFDTCDGEILAAVITGDPTQPWKRYQSAAIIPVTNTVMQMTEAEVVEAAIQAYAKSQSAPALAALHEIVTRQCQAEADRAKAMSEQLHDLEQQWKDGIIDVETFLSGDGIFDADIIAGMVLYCQDCKCVGCENRSHQRYTVDSLMFPILKKLHAKGYRTVFCCSGHADRVRGEYSTYITFSGKYGFEPPEGFVIDTPAGGRDDRVRTLTMRSPNAYKQKVLVEDAQIILDRNLRALDQWADSLPIESEKWEAYG
jgi:hypothetical protein